MASRSSSAAVRRDRPRPGRDARPAAALLRGPLAAGVLDQDAAHGLGGGREEVAAAVPVLGVGRADEPEVRLVDQGGGLEGLAGLLAGQPGGGELAQLVVDEREQLGGGLWVPGRAAAEAGESRPTWRECNPGSGGPRPETRRAGRIPNAPARPPATRKGAARHGHIKIGGRFPRVEAGRLPAVRARSGAARRVVRRGRPGYRGTYCGAYGDT